MFKFALLFNTMAREHPSLVPINSLNFSWSALSLFTHPLCFTFTLFRKNGNDIKLDLGEQEQPAHCQVMARVLFVFSCIGSTLLHVSMFNAERSPPPTH